MLSGSNEANHRIVEHVARAVHNARVTPGKSDVTVSNGTSDDVPT